MRAAVLIGSILFSVGCARERDPAPEDLDGLVRFAFRNFEDPDAMVDAIESLRPWLESDALQPEAHDGLVVSPMTPEDVADVTIPDGADLEAALGVAVGCPSPFSIDAHASLLLDASQTWIDPGGYLRYDRTFEGEAAFEAREGVLRTLNQIERRNVGVTIPFDQVKDYRWVDLGDRWAITSRSIIEESSCSDGGANCVLQGYAIDVFLENEGEIIRMIASWSELDTSIDGLLSEDQLIAIGVNGINGVYENTDLELGRRTE